MICRTTEMLFKRFPSLHNRFKDIGKSNIRYLISGNKNSEVKITRLENGLIVATKPCEGTLSAVGAFIRGGSRFCATYPDGITHVLKQTAFTSTKKYPQISYIGDRVNECQGVIDCQATRDLSAYAIMFSKKHLSIAIELMSQAILNPLFTEQKLSDAKIRILSELDQFQYCPEPEAEFAQLRFQAAYKDNTLGIPELANAESLNKFTCDLMYSYHQQFHVPSRMLIGGINVEHEELVTSVKKEFDFNQTSWADLGLKLPSPDDSIAQYTGGAAIKVTESPRSQPGHAEFPELAHIGLGFQAFKDGDNSTFPAYVMFGLLGSGRSFSAGGPGKGLFSRLNSNVLCRYDWVHSCIAENLSFTDTGLFYIYGSCDPAKCPLFIDVILGEYYSLLKGPISTEELQRAKRQVQSTALSSLEQRSVMLEDLGRNVLSLGKYISPEEIFDKIERVTIEDVKDVCNKILNSNPSLAALGMVHNMPEYKDIQMAVSNRSFVNVKPNAFTRFFT